MTVTCTHSTLVDMPLISTKLREFVCANCEKVLSIPRWNTGCIVLIIVQEFGDAWESEAIRWCICSKHRNEEKV